MMKGNMTMQEIRDGVNGIWNMIEGGAKSAERMDALRKMERAQEESSISPTIFQDTEFGNLEIVLLNGQPYYPARACAKILGYKNTSRAILDYCKEEGMIRLPMSENGKVPIKKYISVANLCRLIQACKLPAAIPFKQMLAEKAASSIRATGEERATNVEGEGGLTVFKNAEFGRVRIQVINGEPWMVGKDVAEALGYSNPWDALSKHVDEEDKLVHQTSRNAEFECTPFQNCCNVGVGEIPNREMIFINESGLYSLTFSSKLPAAKRFRRWVTNTVLPSVLKTGGYINGEEKMTSDELKKATERVLNAKLGQKLNEEMRGQTIDLPTFVQKALNDERVSWNPAQMMEKLLWRYANAACGNNLQTARHELYKNLNEYCGICLWERKSEAVKVDSEKGSRPMYAFLTRQEESLALLFALAMCAYSGAAIGDIVRAYC